VFLTGAVGAVAGAGAAVTKGAGAAPPAVDVLDFEEGTADAADAADAMAGAGRTMEPAEAGLEIFLPDPISRTSSIPGHERKLNQRQKKRQNKSTGLA
jgi:hypothetical protein